MGPSFLPQRRSRNLAGSERLNLHGNNRLDVVKTRDKMSLTSTAAGESRFGASVSP